MAVEGFWLFEGLEEEPYGLLPLANLSGKGGPTSTKYGRRIASYQWYLNEEKPIIVVSTWYSFLIFLLVAKTFKKLLLKCRWIMSSVDVTTSPNFSLIFR